MYTIGDGFPLVLEEGVRSLKAGISDGCELPCMDAEKCSQVLCKSNKSSALSCVVVVVDVVVVVFRHCPSLNLDPLIV